jgi:hypothetical protein
MNQRRVVGRGEPQPDVDAGRATAACPPPVDCGGLANASGPLARSDEVTELLRHLGYLNLFEEVGAHDGGVSLFTRDKSVSIKRPDDQHTQTQKIERGGIVSGKASPGRVSAVIQLAHISFGDDSVVIDDDTVHVHLEKQLATRHDGLFIEAWTASRPTELRSAGAPQAI